MPPGLGLILRQLQEETTGKYSRTDALRPLLYLVLGLIAAVAYLAVNKVPVAVLYAAEALTGAAVVAFVIVHISCLIKKPDMLRSEHYSLTKMAIERSAQGDNITGLIRGDQNKLIETNAIIDVEGE